jgi:anti-anti-sigma regulatory factor
MFRITEQNASGRLVLKLEGRFSAGCVDDLDGCWRAAVESSGGASIWVDLTDVDVIDLAGQEQLTRMHRGGVRFLTRGPLMRELVREICESQGRPEL